MVVGILEEIKISYLGIRCDTNPYLSLLVDEHYINTKFYFVNEFVSTDLLVNSVAGDFRVLDISSGKK